MKAVELGGIRVGDIVLSRTRDLLSKGIAANQSGVSHAALRLNRYFEIDSDVGKTKGVKARFIKDIFYEKNSNRFYQNIDAYQDFRILHLPEENTPFPLDQIGKWSLVYSGIPYRIVRGYLRNKIYEQTLYHAQFGMHPYLVGSGMFCSEFVAQVYADFGIQLGKPESWKTTPSQILRSSLLKTRPLSVTNLDPKRLKRVVLEPLGSDSFDDEKTKVVRASDLLFQTLQSETQTLNYVWLWAPYFAQMRRQFPDDTEFERFFRRNPQSQEEREAKAAYKTFDLLAEEIIFLGKYAGAFIRA